MGAARAVVIWLVLATAVSAPIAIAASSPLLAWREPVYIVAGLAGVIAMALLLVQPLLAGGYLSGLSRQRARACHRIVGAALVLSIVVHVVGLWITSPPDVVDALLFASPTPFSAWGVIAMWAALAAAVLAIVRRRLGPRAWRLGHTSLVIVVVVFSVVHAMMIEGTMGLVSKTALCALTLGALAKAIHDLRGPLLFWRR